MEEHPVFIPYGEWHLAATLALPSGDPRGLVLLLTGLAATRSHRFGMWTRAARRLAEDLSLASLRLDYAGTGDSTRYAARWTGDTWEQVAAALRFGLGATGVSAFGVAGNCLGGRHALRLAAERPDCVGAVCIRPDLAPTEPRGLLGIARRIRGSSEPVSGERREVDPGTRELLIASAPTRVLFLFGRTEARDVDHAARAALSELLRQLPEPADGRLELRVLEDVPLVGFRSVEAQARTIDAVREWMSCSFGA
jgi:pimeloyl-ACP methyl ester carboxylesterase